ncbi:MAG TPA: carboxypeptidase-like regulatory domain-containing protein [Sandaracinaceae bacterium LLY-WYZ-13_1]|nr:carboxypeptidase-like regulatory domain-containing protein [Sandaracinaceae bacterium LLY-WYZ-13_1]
MDRTTGRRSRAVLSLLVLTLAVATAATAMAVDVRGRLALPSDYGEAEEGPEDAAGRRYYWDEWNGFLDPRERGFDAARDLAVVLTGGEMAPEQPGFRLANGGLWPTTIVERAGATLRIENTDPVSHQLYAEGHDELTPTPTSPGLTRQLVVASAGDWAVADAVYGHVTGHLHVLPDLVARAEIQSDGTYAFRNVPPGTYTLKVFHGERMIHSQEGVEVPDGRELTLDPIEIGAAGSEG